jgi:hypothetical protein
MITLYWSPTPLDTETDVVRYASSVEVDAIQPSSLPDEFVIVHDQANGLGIDNNVGYREDISFTISEDEMSRPVIVRGQQAYIRQAVEAFLRTRFKWVRFDEANGGGVLEVRLTEKPAWSHPNTMTDMSEVLVKLKGKVFHQNS